MFYSCHKKWFGESIFPLSAPSKIKVACTENVFSLFYMHVRSPCLRTSPKHLMKTRISGVLLIHWCATSQLPTSNEGSDKKTGRDIFCCVVNNDSVSLASYSCYKFTSCTRSESEQSHQNLSVGVFYILVFQKTLKSLEEICEKEEIKSGAIFLLY